MLKPISISVMERCEKPRSSNKWCIWFRSAENGERRQKIRIANTLKVSSSGINKTENPIAAPEGSGIMLLLKEKLINCITRIALISPISIEPVSPMKIFAGW